MVVIQPPSWLGGIALKVTYRLKVAPLVLTPARLRSPISVSLSASVAVYFLSPC